MKYLLKTEIYSWGILRIIEVGLSRSIIVHPEDWTEIKKVIDDDDDMIEFKDETGKTYGVLKGAGQIFFLEKDCDWGIEICKNELVTAFDKNDGGM